jgi:hypothetical protein
VFPSVAKVEKRLVDDAVVEKWLVVVAFDEVLFKKLIFVKVEDAVAKSPLRNPTVVEVETP